MLLMFQNKTNIEVIGFLLMHFRFSLESSDIDLRNIDLLDTHLDLLGTDTPSKHFVNLQDVLKTSSWHVFKTSSRDVFKTSWRRLQRKNCSSSKTSWIHLQDVLEDEKLKAEEELKTSSRHVLKTSWRRLEDQQMFAG